MAEFPALPLWTDAYLGDTTHLTTIEHGAYLLLLMTAWRTRDCALPDDDRLLARYARLNPQQWKRMRPILELFFHVADGKWRQGRLTDERGAVERHRIQQSEKGRAGAAAKSLKRQERNKAAAKNGLPPASAQGQPDASSLTHLHTQEEEKKEVTAPNGAAPLAFEGKIIRLTKADFDQWGRAYPSIDLPAVLQARDDWLVTDADDGTRKKWFIATSNHLANLQQRATEARREARNVSERITI